MPDKYVKELLLSAYKGNSSSRNDNHIHVSDLIDFCPRKYALCMKHEIPFHMKTYLPVSRSLTFDIGKKIQSIVIERLRRRRDGMLIGTWKCLACKKQFFGQDGKCPYCNAQLLIYKDTKLVLDMEYFKIVGNMDINLIYNDRILIADVKSIKGANFDKLSGTHLNYRKQVNLYLWLARVGKLTVPKKIDLDFYTRTGVLLYVSKEERSDPIKTFLVPYDTDFIIDIEKKLNKLKAFSKNKKGIPRKICTSSHIYMARQCHVSDLCFNQKSFR